MPARTHLISIISATVLWGASSVLPAAADDICTSQIMNALKTKEKIQSTRDSEKFFQQNVIQTSDSIESGQLHADGNGHYGIAGGAASYTRDDLKKLATLFRNQTSFREMDASTVDSYKEFVSDNAKSVLLACIEQQRQGIHTDISYFPDNGIAEAIEIDVSFTPKLGSNNVQFPKRTHKPDIKNLVCTGNLVDNSDPKEVTAKQQIDFIMGSSRCQRVMLRSPRPYGNGLLLANAAHFVFFTGVGPIKIDLPQVALLPEAISRPGTFANTNPDGLPVPFPFSRTG